MAIITQFSTDPVLIVLSDKHHAWHTPGGAHGFPSRQFPISTPGSGHEFFQFHFDLMNQFFAWNAINHGATAADLAAWTAIPVELKLPETGWPNPGFGPDLSVAEARINSNSPPFASDDELGIHVENSIHNWIHGAVAASSILNLPAAEKPIIAGFHSVQSTYFYKIHGLVQYWWNRWLHPKSHIKEVIDHKAAVKELELKHHLKEVLDGGFGKARIKDIKEKDKDKDLVEGKAFSDIPDPFRTEVDPTVITNMIDRLGKLESAVHQKRSPFIKPFMRPEMGMAVAKAPGRKPKK